MSTKSSPSPRPAPASSARRRRRMNRPLDISSPRNDDDVTNTSTTWKDRLRRFLPFTAAPSVVVALTVVALCLAVILFFSLPMAYLPAAIGQTWLTLHGAPVTIDGVRLGFIPLLPPVLVGVLVARRARAATRQPVDLVDCAALYALSLGIPTTLTLIALFMVGDASAVYSIEMPNPIRAIVLMLLVHAIGTAAGIVPAIRDDAAKRFSIPDVVFRAMKPAAQLLGIFVAAGTVVFLILFFAGWGRVTQLVGTFPSLHGGGHLGLILLSILYLPNAVVATLGVLLGASVEYAGVSASLFSVDPVALPPLPLFAAIPGQAASWAPLLLVVPVALTAAFFARRSTGIQEVLFIAVWIGIFAALTLPFVGGSAGAYGYIGAHRGMLPWLAVIWVAAIGALWWLIGRVRRASISEERG